MLRVSIHPQLNTLLKVFHYSGLAHIKYNPVRKKFENSAALRCRSRMILFIGRLMSGFLFFCVAVRMIHFFIIRNGSGFKSHQQQRLMLLGAQALWRYFSTFLITGMYLKNGRILMAVVNETLKIFYSLKARTNAEMYMTSGVKDMFIFRMALSSSRFSAGFTSFLFVFVGEISTPIGMIIMELTFWCLLYANLALGCFYLKLTDFMTTLEGRMSQRKLARHITAILSISFRIHRLKHVLNRFYTTLHLCIYLELFYSVANLYEILRNVLYLKGYADIFSMAMVLWRIASVLQSSYDIFVIGYVGELVTRAESAFRTKLLLMFSMDKHLGSIGWLQQDIDLLLIHRYIDDLSTKAFGSFVINRRFAFRYIANVIFGYAVINLQVFLERNNYSASANQKDWYWSIWV